MKKSDSTDRYTPQHDPFGPIRTQKEVAEIMGLPEKKVWYEERKALKKIKEALLSRKEQDYDD